MPISFRSTPDPNLLFARDFFEKAKERLRIAEEEEAAEEAADEGGGPLGGGIGAAGGMALGAILAAPTGGMSLAAGAALGGSIGGGLGSAAGAAIDKPGSNFSQGRQIQGGLNSASAGLMALDAEQNRIDDKDYRRGRDKDQDSRRDEENQRRQERHDVFMEKSDPNAGAQRALDKQAMEKFQGIKKGIDEKKDLGYGVHEREIQEGWIANYNSLATDPNYMPELNAGRRLQMQKDIIKQVNGVPKSYQIRPEQPTTVQQDIDDGTKGVGWYESENSHSKHLIAKDPETGAYQAIASEERSPMGADQLQQDIAANVKTVNGSTYTKSPQGYTIAPDNAMVHKLSQFEANVKAATVSTKSPDGSSRTEVDPTRLAALQSQSAQQFTSAANDGSAGPAQIGRTVNEMKAAFANDKDVANWPLEKVAQAEPAARAIVDRAFEIESDKNLVPPGATQPERLKAQRKALISEFGFATWPQTLGFISNMRDVLIEAQGFRARQGDPQQLPSVQGSPISTPGTPEVQQPGPDLQRAIEGGSTPFVPVQPTNAQGFRTNEFGGPIHPESLRR